MCGGTLPTPCSCTWHEPLPCRWRALEMCLVGQLTPAPPLPRPQRPTLRCRCDERVRRTAACATWAWDDADSSSRAPCCLQNAPVVFYNEFVKKPVAERAELDLDWFRAYAIRTARFAAFVRSAAESQVRDQPSQHLRLHPPCPDSTCVTHSAGVGASATGTHYPRNVAALSGHSPRG